MSRIRLSVMSFVTIVMWVVRSWEGALQAGGCVLPRSCVEFLAGSHHVGVTNYVGCCRSSQIKCSRKSTKSQFLIGIFVIIKVLDTLVSLSSNSIVTENLRIMMIPNGKYRIANVTCVQR